MLSFCLPISLFCIISIILRQPVTFFFKVKPIIYLLLDKYVETDCLNNGPSIHLTANTDQILCVHLKFNWFFKKKLSEIRSHRASISRTECEGLKWKVRLWNTWCLKVENIYFIECSMVNVNVGLHLRDFTFNLSMIYSKEGNY